MWVYIETEKGLWTVGFYSPSGEFITDSDHDVKQQAAGRVAYLNGRANWDDLRSSHNDLTDTVEELQMKVSRMRDEFTDFRCHYNML